MHEEPNVPNYGRKHHGMKLEPGMVIAIEPMINIGTYRTKVMSDGWLVVTRDGKPSAISKNDRNYRRWSSLVNSRTELSTSSKPRETTRI